MSRPHTLTVYRSNLCSSPRGSCLTPVRDFVPVNIEDMYPNYILIINVLTLPILIARRLTTLSAC